MPCEDAMITKVITIGPDKTVEEGVHMFEKHHLRAIPVVNSENGVIGIFDFNTLLNALLPVSIPGMEGFVGVDIRLDNIIGAAPGVAKRLRKRMHIPVREMMRREFPVVHQDTQLWEGVRLLVKHGCPVPVVKNDTNYLVGLLTPQSVTAQLLKLVREQEKEIAKEQ